MSEDTSKSSPERNTRGLEKRNQCRTRDIVLRVAVFLTAMMPDADSADYR